MIRHNRNRTGGKSTIGAALKSIDRTADRLLRSNDVCLIPESEAIGHDWMNNCHVIAESRLGLIANERGEVLCWPTSTRSIGRVAQRAMSQGSFEVDPLTIIIERYEPVPRGKNHKDCKFTFACHNHDDRVFKPIDSVERFNPGDHETQFKLGLRTIAAYTAWYRGHKKWSQNEFNEDRYIRKVLSDYPFLQPACDAVSEWGVQENAAGRNLEKEVERWRSAYRQLAWHRATTEIRELTPLLRIAATGIPGSQDSPVAMTMLPTENGKCLLLATVLVWCIRSSPDIKCRPPPLRRSVSSRKLFSNPLGKPRSNTANFEYRTLEDETRFSWLTQGRRRTAVQQVAEEWTKSLTELRPAEWLPKLAQQCEFFYVSPHDYYNDEIVTCDERYYIEQAISKKVPTFRI